MHRGVSNLFSLISYKPSVPDKRGTTAPTPHPSATRHCDPRLGGMNEWLPTQGEPSVPLHSASMRKGVQLEALSCPSHSSCWKRRQTLGPWCS